MNKHVWKGAPLLNHNVTSSPEVLCLDKIFELQDRVLLKAVRNHQIEYEFVKDCLELVLKRKIDEKQVVEDDKKKFEIVHSLLNDAFSTLVNSIRLGLYGCDTDSMALLRVVVEELVILNYVISQDLFKTADYELSKKFEKLEFKQVVKSVKDGADIEKMHGRISGFAAHGTAQRLLSNRFTLSGQNLPRAGMAIDRKRTQACLNEIMRAALYMIRILTDFYSTTPKSILQDFFEGARHLEKRFSTFKKN